MPTLVFVVAGLLRDTKGRVLVQRRPAGTSMAGLWEFPGGKVESGETPEAALVRELHEELGIVVRTADLTALTFASTPLGDRHLILLLFGVGAWQGDPHPHHADALQWAHPDELDALAMPPADQPLVAFLTSMPSPSV
jgi:8-oxo-dGTP diphosphatase